MSGVGGGGEVAEYDHTLRLVTERSTAAFGPHAVEETWAVAVLDDGTEVRMRHLGDRVEIRGWDPQGKCQPPSLRADMLGRHGHIVDVSAGHSPDCATVAHGRIANCDCGFTDRALPSAQQPANPDADA